MSEPSVRLPVGAPVHLGAPVTAYRQGRSSRLLFAARLVLWSVLVLGATYLYFGLLGESMLQGVREDTARGLLVLAGVIGLIAWVAVVPGRNLYAYLREWGDIAVEYQNGLACFHRGEWQAVGWRQIENVCRKKKSEGWMGGGGGGSLLDLLPPLVALLSGNTRTYIAGLAHGGSMRIAGSLDEVDSLMDTIEEKCVGCYARARKALMDGNDVMFGRVTVNTVRGLQVNGKWHPWPTVSLDDQTLVIAGRRGSLSNTRIKNTRIRRDEILSGDVLFRVVGDHLYRSGDS